MELLVATGNAHKVAELRSMLEPLGITVVTPDDIGGLPEVVEDGATFAENAVKKAAGAALHTKRWCLADDSGIAVEHLNGAPGVHSARYAGTHGDDAGNNAKLLAELAGVPDDQRTAKFVCALALVDADGNALAVIEGETHGRILESPIGENGFGYDPLFLFTEPDLPQSNRGFATLSSAEKNAISHRGRALHDLAQQLRQLVGAE